MITQPKTLLEQGLQFAQMAAFCIKGTGPQWAAAASGLSVLINILWPNSQPQGISAAQLKTDLTRLQKNLEATVWAGFQSTCQAKLDSALGAWQLMFMDMATGKLDVDLSTPTGQVNAQDWQNFTQKALTYGTWTSSNPLPDIWHWAADQASFQQANTRPEVTRLQTFPFYSAAAGCFLNWAQLGLFNAFAEIKQKAKAAVKAGNASAAKGLPLSPNDNPKNPYFVDQLQALTLFIAYVEGGTVKSKDAAGNDVSVKFDGVLPIVHQGHTALATAIQAVKTSSAYLALKPTFNTASRQYTCPDIIRGDPYVRRFSNRAGALQYCASMQRQMLAKKIAEVEDAHCMNVLTKDELQTIEDTLTQWKHAKHTLEVTAKRHQS
ncbi:MAG: hypothetical protein AAF515_07145 [Pseudomonadota bacterium]